MEDVLNIIKTEAVKVKDNAQKFTKVAVSKTKNIIEEKKYSFTISGIENKIKDIYADLGKIIYEEYENGAVLTDDINSKCEQIESLKEDIEELKKKIADIKNSVVCPECSNLVGDEDDFCSKCGNKIK